MTICRFSVLAFLSLSGCGQFSSKELSPTIRVEAHGNSYSLNDLQSEQKSNPNRFRLTFSDYTVKGIIEDVPVYNELFDKAGMPDLTKYRVPLRVEGGDNFGAMIEFKSFSVEQAAALNKGSSIQVHCDAIDQASDEVSFLGCTSI